MLNHFNQPARLSGNSSDVHRFLTWQVISTLLVITMLAMTACSGSPRRTTGTVLNDQSLQRTVSKSIESHPNFSDDDHIKVEVHQGVVLLAGETVSEENKALATELAQKSRLTERVVNDLRVGEEADFGDKLDNSWLTGKVTSVLVTKNPIPGFDASRIKITSSQNTVYLMGMVSREEGEAVAEIVRNIGGVEKVVKIFDYTD